MLSKSFFLQPGMGQNHWFNHKGVKLSLGGSAFSISWVVIEKKPASGAYDVSVSTPGVFNSKIHHICVMRENEK